MLGLGSVELSEISRFGSRWRTVWEVVDDPGFQDNANPAETTCESLAIEGIRYTIRYGLRVRRTLADDSAGQLVHRPILWLRGVG